MADPSAIAAAMVTVIAAATAAVVTVYNAVAAATDRRAARESRTALAQTAASTDRKADTIISKATEIHSVTNGNLSKLQAQLDLAQDKILALEKLVSTLIATLAATPYARAQPELVVAPVVTPDASVHAHRRDGDPL